MGISWLAFKIVAAVRAQGNLPTLWILHSTARFPVLQRALC